MAGPRRVAVYGEVDPNLVDGSSVWLQSICQVLASIAGVEVTLLLRRPLQPGRRFLLDELAVNDAIELVDAGRPGLLDPAEALDLLERMDRESGGFDVVLLRGQALLTEAAHRDGFDGRLWSYAMTGRGMSEETLRAIASRSARLLCQTEAVAEELRRTVPEANGSIQVLPPMIPDVGSQRERLRTGAQPLRLVYSGKFAPEYCWLETVEAFRALREVEPRAELHVLGDKVHRPTDHPHFHDQAIRALRETEGLRWHGAVPRAAVRGLLAECDLALSIRDPSVEAAREISTKVLEYGAAGLPVVLNRAPAYERLLGEDYPLFVDVPAQARELLLGPARVRAVRAAAADACREASRGFTFGRVTASLSLAATCISVGAEKSDVAASRAGEAPPMVISTPFGIGVKDLAWLRHRLLLLSSITAPSLMAQHDQSFHWVIFADSDLPSEVREGLERILAPFDGRAFVSTDLRIQYRLLELAAEQAAPGGHLFTGRIDDDDAWNRDVVGMARERVVEWHRDRGEAPGFGFTFADGLEWVMYEMIDVDILRKNGQRVTRKPTLRPYRFPFLGTSVFVLSSIEARLLAVSGGHARMGEVLESNDFDVDVITTEKPMWLYCRHKQAESAIQKARGDGVEMALADLVREFGLDGVQVARYLANADSYGYAAVKRIKRFRPQLEKELAQVALQLEDPTTGDAQLAQLQRRRDELTDEITRMSENVVGELQ